MKYLYLIGIIAMISGLLLSACRHISQEIAAPLAFEKPRVPDWHKNAVIYEVNLRHYLKENTFMAFESQLPRLKEHGNRHPVVYAVPVARGGLKTWENIVTCCIECNRLKGDRLPEESGMKLVGKPRRPDLRRALALIFSNRFAPDTWRDYLYFGRRSHAAYGGLFGP